MVSFSVLFRQLTDFVYYHKQNHMIIIDNIISIMIIVLSLLSIYWPLSTFVEILVMRHFFANTDGLPKPVQICSRIAGLPRNLGVALQKCKLHRQDAMRLVGGGLFSIPWQSASWYCVSLRFHIQSAGISVYLCFTGNYTARLRSPNLTNNHSTTTLWLQFMNSPIATSAYPCPVRCISISQAHRNSDTW